MLNLCFTDCLEGWIRCSPVVQVREVLQRAVGNSGGGPPFTPVATTPSPTLEGAEAHPPEGDDEREFDVPVPPANKPLPQREDAPRWARFLPRQTSSCPLLPSLFSVSSLCFSPSSSGSEEEDTDDEEDEEEEAGPTCTPSSQRKGVSFSTPVTMGKRQEGYRGEATPATSGESVGVLFSW